MLNCKNDFLCTLPEWAQFCQGHGRKTAKNHVTLTWKLPWKSCSTTHLPFLSNNPKILKAFLKFFRPKWSLLNAQRKKKKWGKKSEKRGRRESKKLKVKTAVLLLNPKNFGPSAHARTSQANILHLDQKTAKCTTSKRLCGKFKLLKARQWPENRSTSFKMRFWAKSPGMNGLIC